VFRRFQRIGRDKVGCLKEVAPHLRCKEQNRREHHQEDDHADDVLHRVVRMERNAIKRDMRDGILVFLDLDAVRVVGAHFVQRHQVNRDQGNQHQRQRNDVKREEAVQRGI